MADHEHRHRLPRQVVLQPFRGLDIEVVGGLVQEHQVGALEQELGEHQPRLLAARERAGRTVEVGCREPQSAEDLLDAMVDRVGILVDQQLVQLVIPAAGAIAVALVFGLGHLLGRFLELALEVQERGQARPGHVHQRLVGPELGLLHQQADPDSRPDVDAPILGRLDPVEQLHERGLARPVGPDQTDPLTGADLEGQDRGRWDHRHTDGQVLERK